MRIEENVESARKRTPCRLCCSASASIILILFLAGCSTAGPRGAELAATGGKSARSASATLTALGDAAQGAVEKRELTVAFGKQAQAPDAVLNDMTEAADAIYQRARMLDQIGNAYDAFGKLAAYNASDPISAAFKNLDGATQAYATAIHATLPAGFSELTQAAGALTGLFVNARRDQMLYEGSAQFRQRLVAIDKLLRYELVYYTSMRKDAAEKQQMLLDAAVENNLLDASSLIAAHLTVTGATADKTKIADFVAPKGAMKAEWAKAIKAILARRADTEFAATQKALEGSADLITKLIKAHEDFEAKKPLSLDEIATETASIQALADVFLKYKKASQ